MLRVCQCHRDSKKDRFIDSVLFLGKTLNDFLTFNSTLT